MALSPGLSCYYVNRRRVGKTFYYCPEQFTQDWDLLPGNEPDGDNVCDEPIAGNYGPATNVWHIGMTMYTLITRCLPPRPPQPEDIVVNHRVITTFGRPLNQFHNTERSLRTLVKRCLAYDPADRPSLRRLLHIVRPKVRNDKDPNDPNSESNEVVRAWVRHAIFNAPIPQEHNPDPDDPGLGILDDDPNDLDYVP
ncbi:hypothetical protein SLS62_006598 [Diatrype stigma]|uniref:Protein kinase domain-containing protein n=1 Tax=Diatrype stigma TaxID=117547 RepID=A0AAN9UP93_9PEZI